MGRGRKGRRTKAMVDIAEIRINLLFSYARNEALTHNFDRANRYVELARKIGKRYNVRIPKVHKKRFCKHCYHYLLPSYNCKVRLQKSKIVITCFDCGKYMRIPFKEKGRISK